MNKKVLIVGAIVLAAAVVIFLLTRNNSINPLSQTSTPQSADEMSNLVMNAFDGSGSVKCTFQDETSRGTTYIKNGKVRVESAGTDGAQYGNVIMKDDTVWVWETGNTEGFMMENISQYQNDPEVSEDYKVDADKVREEIAENEGACVNENISDDVFNPPAEVTFQNYSSMMENIQTQMPEGYQLPEGVELPEGFEYPSN